MSTVHRITISDAERERLTEMTRRGTATARDVRRAQALLRAARDQADASIAAAIGVHARTVARWRERAATHGVACQEHLLTRYTLPPDSLAPPG